MYVCIHIYVCVHICIIHIDVERYTDTNFIVMALTPPSNNFPNLPHTQPTNYYNAIMVLFRERSDR